MNDISKQIEEFLARGGKVVEIPVGVTGEPEKITFGNKTVPEYELPSSGHRYVMEKTLADGRKRYHVKIHSVHYGVLPSLDLAINRRDKICYRLGIKLDKS
jgi:hypothetical protein